MNTRRKQKKDVEFSQEHLIRGNKLENTLKKSIDKKNSNVKIKKQSNNSLGQGEIPDRR